MHLEKPEPLRGLPSAPLSTLLRGVLAVVMVAALTGCSRFEPLEPADATPGDDAADTGAGGLPDVIGGDVDVTSDAPSADPTDTGPGGDTVLQDTVPDAGPAPEDADAAEPDAGDTPPVRVAEPDPEVIDDATPDGIPDAGPDVSDIGPEDIAPDVPDVDAPDDVDDDTPGDSAGSDVSDVDPDAPEPCEVPGLDCPCTADEQCDDLVDAGQCERAACIEGTCQLVADDDANGLPCTDGSGCTGSDQCIGGECIGQPFVCNDGNECTNDFCDEQLADCVHEPLAGAACDDNNVCTVADACQASGNCSGTPVTCPDGPNPCIVPTCSQVTGVCNLNTFPDSETQCGQPNACGAAPVCDGAGSCVEAEDVPCEDDGVDCTSDVCDPLTGACVHLPIEDGQPCGPQGDGCFVGPVCQAGVCLDGFPVAFHTTLDGATTSLAVDLLQVPWGFVALSINETPAGDSDALIQHVSTAGEVGISETFGSSDSDIPRALVARPGGGYAFAGLSLSTSPYQGWVVFVDDQGQLEAQHVAGAATDLGIETVQAMGEDLLVAGTVAPATAWWARVDEQAGVVEEHMFEDLPLTLLTTSAPDVGGGYVLGGFALSGAGSELLLLEVDDEGELLDSQLPNAGLTVQPTAMAIAPDGVRVIAGFELSPTGGSDAYVWRVSPSGVLIDATPVGVPGDRSLYSVAIDPVGRILAGGRAAPANGSGPAWLVGLEDVDGDLQSTFDKVYADEATSDRLLGLIPDDDGSAWLLGSALNGEGLELPWFARVTEFGDAVCTQ